MMEVYGPQLPAFYCYVCTKERLQVDLMPEDVVLALFKDSEHQRVFQIQVKYKLNP
jgi:hypothetical protein